MCTEVLAPLRLDQTVTETDGKARDLLRNPLKDVDVRTVETALAGALGTLLKQRLTVDIHALDFPAASHRTAKLTLTVSVPVDFGLLRGSRQTAAIRERPASSTKETAQRGSRGKQSG